MTIMSKKLSKEQMKSANIIATKEVPTGVGKLTKIRYVKICWNCEKPFESARYDAMSCSKKCNVHVRKYLSRGVMPPVRMEGWKRDKKKEEALEGLK